MVGGVLHVDTRSLFIGEVSVLAQSAHRTSHPHAAARFVAAFLSLALIVLALWISQPAPALGSTTMAAACSASLRTKPYTTATRKAVISAGTKVSVVATVSGGKWSTTCGTKSVSGSYWYRINAVNGKSVYSLYHVTYVYAAKGLFKSLTTSTTSTTLQAACDANLRTSTSTSATRKATISAGTKVTVVGSVSGGSWSATCGSTKLSGSAWYKISAVNGKSVSSLYGVSYVYGAKGLFKTVTASPSPTATPKPTVAPIPTPTPTPTPPPTSSKAEGIDVSHWQGTITWTQVRGAGKKFAYIKASEDADFVDPFYATNRAQAKAAGLVVGAYHFARPATTAGDATAEADHFISTAGFTTGELLPVLDLEVTGGLTSTQLQAWVKGFLTELYTKTGVRGVIYVSPSFWKTNMGDTTWFAQNGYGILWIAHWTTASAPTVPGSNWGGYGWTFWQYTSNGTVSGISVRVDLDRYKGTDFSPVLIK